MGWITVHQSFLGYTLNIVVVEDHEDLRSSVLDYLSQEGYTVNGASCGEDLDELMARQSVDLIILDVNLPGESGFDIARRIRAVYPGVSVIMLTVRDEEYDRITGYDSGADLYLAKPISPTELTAVVRSVYRRKQSTVVARTGLELNVSRLVLLAPKTEVALSKLDAVLLKALATAPDWRLPYWRLFEVTERSLDSEQSKGQLELQVFRLRKKLVEHGLSEDLIKAVRREGYQLTEPMLVTN